MAGAKSSPERGGGPAQLVEGHVRKNMTSMGFAIARRRASVTRRRQARRPVPLHQLRWSPSPKGEDFVTTPSPKKSDLGVRTASAVVMLAVAGTALWLGGWWWTVLVLFVGFGVMREWVMLANGFAASAKTRLLWLVGGAIYCGLAATMLIVLRDGPTGLLPVLAVLSAVIATDVGAYFAGRTIGGPKIAPAISPSKTWAGLGGGYCRCLACAGRRARAGGASRFCRMVGRWINPRERHLLRRRP